MGFWEYPERGEQGAMAVEVMDVNYKGAPVFGF